MINENGVIIDPEEIVLLNDGRRAKLSISIGEHEQRWYFGVDVSYPEGGFGSAPGPGYEGRCKWYSLKNEAIAAAIEDANEYIKKTIAWYGGRGSNSNTQALQKLLAACIPPQRSFSFMARVGGC